MAFTEVRTIKGKKYYYRVLSVRKGSKVSKKRVYLGFNLLDKILAEKERLADKELLHEKISKSRLEIENIKSRIARILRKNSIKKAGIFGSFSRGEQKKSSDIDIAVEITNNKMSLLDFIKLNRLLEKILKRKVDLVEYSAIKPRIRDRILKEEVRIL